MRVLDLFSGIGGFSLGLERAGMETVAFCEFDEHAQKVLKNHWPDVPIHDDVRSLNGEQYRGSVDVVCGGFPCQDLSTAGEQAGINGERSGLYGEMLRIIGECKPRWAIFENVSNLLTGGNGLWFSQFLNELASFGYDAEWNCITASDIGAHHHRNRVWIVAYPNKTFREGRGISVRIHKELSNSYGRSSDRVASKILADTLRIGQQGQRELEQSVHTKAEENREAARFVDGCIGQIWEAEPSVGRVVDGVPGKLDRFRLARLGNAVVPQIPEIIGRAIMTI